MIEASMVIIGFQALDAPCSMLIDLQDLECLKQAGQTCRHLVPVTFLSEAQACMEASLTRSCPTPNAAL